MNVYLGDLMLAENGGSGIKYGYVDYLVVAGGGGIGADGSGSWGWQHSGGAGAGGALLGCCYPVQCDCYPIIVGKGGQRECNGGDSSFDLLCAYGGGAGPSCGRVGNDGGSGAGSSLSSSSSGGKGVCGQGHDGGGTDGGLSFGFGGGGGAGCPGEKGVQGNGVYGGKGGDGIQSDIDGTTKWYAGGGGGGARLCTRCSGEPFCSYGVDGCGQNNCGGGGNHDTVCGKDGVIILRYKTNGSCGLRPESYGGCKYQCGDWTIHCFTNTNQTEYFYPVYK